MNPEPVETSTFYRDRHLTVPTGELRPESPEQLREAVRDLESNSEPWRIIGDGQHVQTGRAEEPVAIRTDQLNGLVDLDAKSGLARVRAGTRWRDLRDRLADDGFSVQRYGLHPASATVGGMLARRRVAPHLLRGGELLDGCVALGGWKPDSGDYRYLVAPRKASGPDLRYEFAGAGDSGNAILDATLEVWRPVEQRVFRYEDCPPWAATAIAADLFDAGITPVWTHYTYPGGTLQFALAMPDELLRARHGWIVDEIGEPDETLDGEDVDARRAWLEARHPDRRSHPDAEDTRVFWLVPSVLEKAPENVLGDDLRDFEAIRWTPRRVEVYARYDVEPTDDAAPELPERTCWAHRSLIGIA